MSREIVPVEPGSFEPERHYYPRVLNAHLHPLVQYFLQLGNERIALRYCHLHPDVTPESIRDVLSMRTDFFRWGGADLFHATTAEGRRRIVVIETNSCPSGQKSIPLFEDHDGTKSGYHTLLERSFLPILKRRSLPSGELAVIYDKNEMEASGYAAALADLTGETVFLAPFFDGETDRVRVADGVLEVRPSTETRWRPIRAAFRYVTQRPWNRIPPLTKTAIFNPVLVCLAGGRNKMLAAKAYEMHNAELFGKRLRIVAPETMWHISKAEIPLWVNRMGGIAVIKDPYSNAGQGVYTVTSAEELAAFMAEEHRYDRFIVQALIGNSDWSSRTPQGCLFHVGTVPDRKHRLFVADLRFMVGNSPDGFYPVAIYARRARSPLTTSRPAPGHSWDVLGTNLSVRDSNGSWSTQTERLLLMDTRDFNRLGLGMDDLVEAYIQSALSVTAIDRLASNLLTRKKVFRKRLFGSLNPDPAYLREIMP